MARAAGAREERHRLVIDRREGELAVVQLEDGRVADLPAWALPPGAGDGDVIEVRTALDDSGARLLTLRIDPEATQRAKDAAASLLDRLRARDPDGDEL